MDKIIIEGMKLYGFHGFLEAEKTLGQNFYIDIEVFCDLKEACESDNLDKTLNYALLYEKIEKLNNENKFDLIEKFAEEISKKVLEFEIVKKTRIRVSKPEAPISASFKTVAVEIEREK